MIFIDEVEITAQSGKGGDGMSHFRREKFVPYGGPDGGDGGNGGSVYLKATSRLNTLAHYRGKKVFKALDGDPGSTARKNGKDGADIELFVPLGTLIKDLDSGFVLADLTEDEESFCLCAGGRGGLGNWHFRTSTNQAPEKATQGKDGERKSVVLELKLMADIGLIGLPNAGKSTLLSRLSRAKPKIADYPFTTLIPQLGVLKVPDTEKEIVLADIPGLIEGASQGKGLGIEFLKHIERTKAFVHLIDCSLFVSPFEAIESYSTIRNELAIFNPELLNRKELVVLTKIDALTLNELEHFQKALEETLDKSVLPISAVSGAYIDQLVRLLYELTFESST